MNSSIVSVQFVEETRGTCIKVRWLHIQMKLHLALLMFIFRVKNPFKTCKIIIIFSHDSMDYLFVVSLTTLSVSQTV
jgi:hypothetical protein